MAKQTKRRRALATAPKFTRFAKATGSQPRVDRTGGAYGQGLITGVSVITKGEALGHYTWIDEVFLGQIVEAANAFRTGIKSRWTHPDMSSDGMGKLTSRLRSFSMADNGIQVLADQHFLKIGHRSPDGDLAAYQMDLAEEDPEAYGLSIVFTMDRGEMDRFSSKYKDKDGNFKSPDPENTNHYQHARLAELWAADAVDEPAANPNGLFSRERDIAREAHALTAFALGLSNDRPEILQLGLDADRVRSFATRFLLSHELEIAPMKKKLSEGAANPPADEKTGEAQEGANTGAESQTESTEGEGKTGEKSESESEPPAAVAAGSRAEAAKFHKAFGAKAMEYFAAGMSFEEASIAFNNDSISSLAAEVKELKTQLAAGGKVNGQQSPVGFQTGEEKGRKGFRSKFKVPNTEK